MQATTALASPKWIQLGVGSGTNNMHIGVFDNTYYTAWYRMVTSTSAGIRRLQTSRCCTKSASMPAAS